MNTRSKRQSPDGPVQPKLKTFRSDVTLEPAITTLNNKQEILNFVSTIFCELSPGIWLQILANDDEKQSIQYNLGIKSSLLHPLLRDAGIIGTNKGKPSVNLTYANDVFFNHNFHFSYIKNNTNSRCCLRLYFICYGKPRYKKVTHQLKDPLFYYPSPTKKSPFITKAINILKAKVADGDALKNGPKPAWSAKGGKGGGSNDDEVVER